MLPVAEAKTRASSGPRGAREQRPRATTASSSRSFRSRHVAAEEMANILQPFVTPGGDVLVVSARERRRRSPTSTRTSQRLRELVATFDIDGFRNLHARVFKVKRGRSRRARRTSCSTLLAPYGVTPTGEGEGGVSWCRSSRLNAIVAFALDRAAFSARSSAGSRCSTSRPTRTSGRQTFVYNVENAKAADLAAVLNELFGGGAGRAAAASADSPRASRGGVGLFGAGGAAGAGGGGAFRRRTRRCGRRPFGGGRRRSGGEVAGAAAAFGADQAGAGGGGGAARRRHRRRWRRLRGGGRRRGGLAGGAGGVCGRRGCARSARPGAGAGRPGARRVASRRRQASPGGRAIRACSSRGRHPSSRKRSASSPTR